MSPLIAEGLLVLAAVLGWRAIRHLDSALRHSGDEDSSARLIRGIRALIAAVILGEELYETGVVLLALRRRS